MKTDKSRNREAMVAVGKEARVVAQRWSVRYGHSTDGTLVMDWKWRVLSEKEESDLRNWVEIKPLKEKGTRGGERVSEKSVFSFGL